MFLSRGILRPRTLATAVAVAFFFAGSSTRAQPAGEPAPIERELTLAGVPLARAFRVEQAPEIDGDVLEDPAWADVLAVTDFRQTTSDEGQPASERTEVRILYTRDTIYFGIVCYVTDPRTIIVADSRRDSSLDDTDSFQIIIDTYLDKQNGFVFGTNPAGLEYDGQVTNEGQGSGRFGGGGRRSGRPAATRLRWRLQPQLGWRVAGPNTNDRHRLVRRDRDPVPHSPLSHRRGADVGHQLSAQYPEPERDGILGAAAPSVQPVSSLACPARCRGSRCRCNET